MEGILEVLPTIGCVRLVVNIDASGFSISRRRPTRTVGNGYM